MGCGSHLERVITVARADDFRTSHISVPEKQGEKWKCSMKHLNSLALGRRDIKGEGWGRVPMFLLEILLNNATFEISIKTQQCILRGREPVFSGKTRPS